MHQEILAMALGVFAKSAMPLRYLIGTSFRLGNGLLDTLPRRWRGSRFSTPSIHTGRNLGVGTEPP